MPCLIPVMRAFKIYSISNFQLSNILTIITVLTIDLQNLISPKWNFDPVTNISPIISPHPESSSALPPFYSVPIVWLICRFGVCGVVVFMFMCVQVLWGIHTCRGQRLTSHVFNCSLYFETRLPTEPGAQQLVYTSLSANPRDPLVCTSPVQGLQEWIMAPSLVWDTGY